MSETDTFIRLHSKQLSKRQIVSPKFQFPKNETPTRGFKGGKVQHWPNNTNLCLMRKNSPDKTASSDTIFQSEACFPQKQNIMIANNKPSQLIESRWSSATLKHQSKNSPTQDSELRIGTRIFQDPERDYQDLDTILIINSRYNIPHAADSPKDKMQPALNTQKQEEVQHIYPKYCHPASQSSQNPFACPKSATKLLKKSRKDTPVSYHNGHLVKFRSVELSLHNNKQRSAVTPIRLTFQFSQHQRPSTQGSRHKNQDAQRWYASKSSNSHSYARPWSGKQTKETAPNTYSKILQQQNEAKKRNNQSAHSVEATSKSKGSCAVSFYTTACPENSQSTSQRQPLKNTNHQALIKMLETHKPFQFNQRKLFEDIKTPSLKRISKHSNHNYNSRQDSEPTSTQTKQNCAPSAQNMFQIKGQACGAASGEDQNLGPDNYFQAVMRESKSTGYYAVRAIDYNLINSINQVREKGEHNPNTKSVYQMVKQGLCDWF